MKHQVVLTYHSLEDPILKGLLLRYLTAYQVYYPGQHFFHLITFEQEAYSLSKQDKKQKMSELSVKNIAWLPVQYHTGGRLILLKKVWDLALALFYVIRLKWKYPVKSVIGFTSISSVLAFIASKAIGVRSICFNVEPHSDYMKEFDIWGERSLNYKVLNYLEKQIFKRCDHLAVPTRNAQNDFKNFRTRKINFVPTSIDMNDFSFNENSRKALRKKINISPTQNVVLYLGKFGGIYFTASEMAKYFRSISANTEANLLFFIITNDDVDKINKVFEQEGPSQFIVHERVSYECLSDYMSMVDVGLLILPEYPSQRYRCPIKTANYLACGLPIIVNEIVGDDPLMVKNEKVGWMIDLQNPSIKFDNFPTRNHCRQVISKERDLTHVINFLNYSLTNL